jgi:hypothetical protein
MIEIIKSEGEIGKGKEASNINQIIKHTKDASERRGM